MPPLDTLPEPLRVIGGTRVAAGGRTLDYFAGCDYLGLAWEPTVQRAIAAAAKTFGVSIGASRTTTGNHPLLLKLEAALARFFGTKTATLLPGGYLADAAAAQALAGEINHVLIDARAHPALRDAARFVGAPVTAFRHRDAEDLRRQARRFGRSARILVMTDGMFAFDGSLAPLREYFKILPERTRLLVDDAHAAGVLGAHGRGSAEYWRLNAVHRAHVIQTISLSKVFGAGGGAVLGSEELRRAILKKSAAFAGATPPSPALAAAALAALKIAQRLSLRKRLVYHVLKIRAALRASGQAAGEPSPSPIVAIFPRSEKHARELRAALLSAGIYPPLIRYSGGPANGFFRFAISSAHTPAQLRRLAKALNG